MHEIRFQRICINDIIHSDCRIHTSLSRSFSAEKSDVVSDDVKLWLSSDEESVEDVVDNVVGADEGDSNGSCTSRSGLKYFSSHLTEMFS